MGGANSSQRRGSQGRVVQATVVGPAVPNTPVTVVARTIGGETYTVQVTLQDTVVNLKILLAEQAVSADRQKLLFQNVELQDNMVLGHVVAPVAEAKSTEVEGETNPNLTGEAGAKEAPDEAVVDGRIDVELTMVIMPPRHEVDKMLGLGADHPTMLREYYAKHGLEVQGWMESDAEVWDKLKEARVKREEKKAALAGWSHSIMLRKEGEPACTLRAKPGETLSVDVSGFIHNNKGDSCIQQLVLALDNQLAGDVYDGVPGRGRNIGKSVQVKAPNAPGAYMLWRYSDLQYSMADAKRNFQNRHGEKVQDKKYPDVFVGWVVVEEAS